MKDNIEEKIRQIVDKVRTVEFLHGVPVYLPAETIELLRSGIRKALTEQQALHQKEMEEVKNLTK